jgi:hypothetical protein
VIETTHNTKPGDWFAIVMVRSIDCALPLWWYLVRINWNHKYALLSVPVITINLYIILILGHITVCYDEPRLWTPWCYHNIDPNHIGYIIIIRTKELHILQNDTHGDIKPNPNTVTFVTLAPTCPNYSFPILSPKIKCQQCDPKNDPIQWLRMVSSGGYMYYELIPIISPNWSVSTLPAWQHYQQTNSYGTSIMKVDHFQGKQTMYYLWKILVSWGYILFPIYGKKCSKPPTRSCTSMALCLSSPTSRWFHQGAFFGQGGSDLTCLRPPPGHRSNMTYCGWKKSCITKRMVESLRPTNNGMFTIYQLVQDFATIHCIWEGTKKYNPVLEKAYK